MPIKTVDAKTFKQWMKANEVVIVDVREPDEYEAQNIPGAILQPLGEINVKNLPSHKNKKLVVHCKLGKRGMAACEKLVAEDPSLEIYNLEGGISSWLEEK